jgi:hypothetical protein
MGTLVLSTKTPVISLRPDVRRRHFRNILSAAMVCLSLAAAVKAEQPLNGWTIMNGQPPEEAKTRLCLAGSSFASAFSYRRMKPLIDPPGGTGCYELLRADLQRRFIYLDFGSGDGWRPVEGADGVRCGSGDSYRQNYNPCTSRFFSAATDSQGRSGVRKLNREELTLALAKSGSIIVLDQAVADERARIDAAGYARYQAEYRDAITLEKITAFEQRYAGSDRDSLIPTLQPRKRSLLHERYRTAFDSAESVGDLATFIETYTQNDPDGLIPQARKRLAQQEARDRAMREKKASAERIAAQLAKRKEAEARVSNCKRMTAMAYATLERERHIAAVSGVENLAVKRRAGEIIVACQQIIGRGY